MRIAAVAPLLLLALPLTVRAELTPTRLRCEYRIDPLAVDDPHPRLFWTVESRQRSQKQSAYRILAASSPQKLAGNEGDLWDSGKVASDETIQIPYAGKPLRSRQQVWWKVMVWDSAGKGSGWSKAARWSVGLPAERDWSAEWIAAPVAPLAPDSPKPTPEGARWIWFGGEPNPVGGKRYFRLRFELPAGVRSAALAVSADDAHTTSVNGKVAAQGTSWQVFQVADVGQLLKAGANEITVEAQNSGENAAGLVATLVVQTDAGQSVWITDPAWEGAKEPGGPWTPVRVLGDYGMDPWKIGRSDAPVSMAPAAYFRKRFTLTRPVTRATLYATALGLYELSCNGKPIGDDALAPGWTEYKKRTLYHAYEVTDRLQAGENVLGAVLGDGWYASYLAFTGRRRYYGGDPALRAQLVIDYADGSSETIGTDGTWRAGVGPIVSADMLMGATLDFRKEQPGWDAPGFAEGGAGWSAARAVPAPKIAVEAHPGSAVRPQERLVARQRTSPKPGVWVYDLGQNLSGWARIAVRGRAGQTIVVRHAERLNADGTLYTTNLRAARATDSYTLAHDGVTLCEPHFTFHGFQYVEITGCETPPDAKDVVGVVLHSDLPRAGSFVSDNPLLNKLALNTDWGQRGNYLDVPTDCPQRDERAGWTGDAQVFTKAAAFNRDIAPFYTKWLTDLLEDSQRADGAVADVAPYIDSVGYGNAAWEDSAVVCVYRMYEMYGDTRAIERHWPALTRFMGHLAAVAPEGLRAVGAYGDWLLLDGPQHSRVHGTAYYFQDAKMMAELARAIGKGDEAAKYDALATKVKDAFNKAFVTDDARVEENGRTGQTFYALALAWNLLPDAKRLPAARRLVRLLNARGDHLATGFIGTPALLPALRGSGQASLADKLLLSETYPSWLFQVKLGATTMWERWDGWTPEKGFQDPGMNSFNHYWLGCVTEYLHTAVGGVDTSGPGFKKLVLRPETDSGLRSARSTYESIRGTVVSDWSRRADGGLVWTVTVPANVTAAVYLPAAPTARVLESGKPIAATLRDKERALVEIGSGTYRFEVRPR